MQRQRRNVKCRKRSWLLKPQIKEIIIVDWSSQKSLQHLENIDERIKVIRIEGEEFYNASKPINIAIKAAKYEKNTKKWTLTTY